MLDLCCDLVLLSAEECLDVEMPIDAVENRLDLPATFVKPGGDKGWKLRIGGKN